jgi:hypothetical protein
LSLCRTERARFTRARCAACRAGAHEFDLKLFQEREITTLHQRAAAGDTPAQPIAEMIAGIGPIGVDAVQSIERTSKLTARRGGEKPVECLEHERQSPRPQVRLANGLDQGLLCDETRQTAQQQKTSSEQARIDDRRSGKADGPQNTLAPHAELKAPAGKREQNMLLRIRQGENRSPARQSSDIEGKIVPSTR